MSVRVAFLDDVHPTIRAVVKAHMPQDWNVTFTASRLEGDRRDAAANAEIAFIIGTGVDAGLLKASPELTFIQKLGSGTDKIDRAACIQHGVAVARLQAGNAVQVAEHTVMMMLAALRRLPYFHGATREGNWLKEEGRGTQRQLSGKKVGLLGFGAIGREVAKRLRGFDVALSYYDPNPAPTAVEQELSIVRRELGELIATSDIISLHLPLLAQTRHLLSERRFALMKRGVTIINCARGGLVDEAALHSALDRGDVFAAGLDTFEHEPPGNSLLLGRSDVVVTPHLAGATLENFEVVFRRGLRNAELFLGGQALPGGELIIAPQS